MIRELDTVVLTAPLPAEGLEPGELGAVIHVYGDSEAYEVEFLTLTGETAAVVTVTPGQIRAVARTDIHHARAVAIS